MPIKKIVFNALKYMLGLNREFDVGTTNDSERERRVAERLGKIARGSRILDAGAGELRYKKHCGHLDYVAQDFGGYDGAGDSKGLQTEKWDQTKLDIICDIVNIPEKAASFDAVLCVEVFEHLPEPILALKEFARLLKSGGTLLITAPFASLTHFAPYHFYSGFNKYFFEKFLNEYGFKDIEITPYGNYFEYIAQEIRRLDGVADKYCGARVKGFEKIAVMALIKMLHKYSKKDRGSSELLCYGYEVTAVRK